MADQTPSEPSRTSSPGAPTRPAPAMECPAGLKQWLLVQIAGGVVAIVGLLLATYYFASAAQTGTKPQFLWPVGVLVAGVGVHAVGRLGARRLR